MEWRAEQALRARTELATQDVCKAASRLADNQEDAQYEGVVANDPQVFDKYERVVVKFIAFVMNRTPLCHYEEFILDLVHKQSIGPSVEFDYYCPKSYVHKDRCQYQVTRQRVNTRTIALLSRAGRETIERLHGSRIEDYVLGWNNRLGQSAEAFLLFLDIDHSDEGDVKAALKGQQGWLFKTGAGYHFIGKKPIESDEEWRSTMKRLHRSKGLKKLLDRRYLEYSLRRGFSTVRITRSPVKTFRPFLCAEISENPHFALGTEAGSPQPTKEARTYSMT